MSDEERQKIWEQITLMQIAIKDIQEEIKKYPSFEEDLENIDRSEDHSIEWDR